MKLRPAIVLSAYFLMLCPLPSWAEQDSGAQNQNEDLRLELQRVSLAAETNRMDEAFDLLDKLKAQYPDNPQVLQAEADLNLRLGNRGAGFAALNRALILDPGNEDIMDRQRIAMLGQGPFVAGGYKFRRSKQAKEQLESVSGQVAVSPSVSVGITLENDHLQTRQPITGFNGTTQNFSIDRQRGTVTLGKIYDSGNEASASLYAGNNTIGAGALYRFWDRQGTTAIAANWQRPDWDYVETVIENGTKDNIRLERKQIFSGALQVTLGGGYNRYNLEDDDNVAEAAAWDLNVGYTAPYSISSDNTVTLGAYYTVDAEYFTHVNSRTVGLVTFNPLPAKDYEVHSLNLSASKELSSHWYIEGFGGYSVDRLGGNGPSFGGALGYLPLEHLGAELYASRGIVGERNGGKVDQVGLNLKWRW